MIFLQQLKQIINELIQIHESLLTVSKKKTDLVKLKQVDDLPPLLMDENKQLQLLEKAEQKRLQIVTPFFEKNNVAEDNRTVTTLLELINDTKVKAHLEKKFVTLTDLMVELKNQEQLNSELIQQSLQLIQLSLGMINPTMQNMNYGKQHIDNKPTSRSMFDSKA